MNSTPQAPPSRRPTEVWTQDAQPPELSTQRRLSFGEITPTEPSPPSPVHDASGPDASGPGAASTRQIMPAPKVPPSRRETADAPSRLTLLKRINRVMEPNAKGEFKVSEEIRQQWKGAGKEGVFKLFAESGNNADAFIKRFSATRDSEREMQIGVEFEFLTKQVHGTATRLKP